MVVSRQNDYHPGFAPILYPFQTPPRLANFGEATQNYEVHQQKERSAMDTRQTFSDSTEVYRAAAPPAVAAAAGVASPFTIEVKFIGGLTQAQRDAFKAAADRWVRVIIGDLPDVLVEGDVIDDVLILAQGADIDGPNKVLGQAGPTFSTATQCRCRRIRSLLKGL